MQHFLLVLVLVATEYLCWAPVHILCSYVRATSCEQQTPGQDQKPKKMFRGNALESKWGSQPEKAGLRAASQQCRADPRQRKQGRKEGWVDAHLAAGQLRAKWPRCLSHDSVSPRQKPAVESLPCSVWPGAKCGMHDLSSSRVMEFREQQRGPKANHGQVPCRCSNSHTPYSPTIPSWPCPETSTNAHHQANTLWWVFTIKTAGTELCQILHQNKLLFQFFFPSFCKHPRISLNCTYYQAKSIILYTIKKKTLLVKYQYNSLNTQHLKWERCLSIRYIFSSCSPLVHT